MRDGGSYAIAKNGKSAELVEAPTANPSDVAIDPKAERVGAEKPAGEATPNEPAQPAGSVEDPGADGGDGGQKSSSKGK